MNQTNHSGNNTTTKFTVILFGIYIIVLIWILLFKLSVKFSYMQERRTNLIPFREPIVLDEQIYHSETFLNILVFVPLGIYAGILFKKWAIWKKCLVFLLLSSMIEGLQFIFRIGAFDITDIITNSIGGIAGLVVLAAAERIFNNSITAQRIINIFAAIGTVVIVSFLLLLKMNMLPLRYQ